MAISKLSIPQYVDGVTRIEAGHLNAIVSTINQLVEVANGSSSGGTTPTAPSAPTITINGTSATISAVSGATIKYTIDGSNPSASVGTTYSGAITLSDSCTIKAVAIKDGLVSSVVSKAYIHQSTEPDVEYPIEIQSIGTLNLVQDGGVYTNSSTNTLYYIEIELDAQYEILTDITGGYSYVGVCASVPSHKVPYLLQTAGGKGTLGYFAKVSSSGRIDLSNNAGNNPKEAQIDLVGVEHLYLTVNCASEYINSFKFRRIG